MPQAENMHFYIRTISEYFIFDFHTHFGCLLFLLNYLQHITFKGTQTKVEIQNINHNVIIIMYCRIFAY